MCVQIPPAHTSLSASYLPPCLHFIHTCTTHASVRGLNYKPYTQTLNSRPEYLYAYIACLSAGQVRGKPTIRASDLKELRPAREGPTARVGLQDCACDVHSVPGSSAAPLWSLCGANAPASGMCSEEVAPKNASSTAHAIPEGGGCGRSAQTHTHAHAQSVR
jgi:hypothetical protein